MWIILREWNSGKSPETIVCPSFSANPQHRPPRHPKIPLRPIPRRQREQAPRYQLFVPRYIGRELGSGGGAVRHDVLQDGVVSYGAGIFDRHWSVPCCPCIRLVYSTCLRLRWVGLFTPISMRLCANRAGMDVCLCTSPLTRPPVCNLSGHCCSSVPPHTSNRIISEEFC